MALLRKPYCWIGWAARYQRTRTHALMPLAQASLLHTQRTPPNDGNQYLALTMRDFLKDPHKFQPSKCGGLLSLNCVTPSILPSLPHGRPAVLDLPALSIISGLEMPTSKASLNNAHIMPEKDEIREPNNKPVIEKKAVRMIVIRRKKIKKHLLKKHRKRFRIMYMRRKQAKRALKEKRLQEDLISKLNEGRGFDAKKYAYDLLVAAYKPIELPPKLVEKKPWEV